MAIERKLCLHNVHLLMEFLWCSQFDAFWENEMFWVGNKFIGKNNSAGEAPAFYIIGCSWD